jgi:class 3 adenylate cyclase
MTAVAAIEGLDSPVMVQRALWRRVLRIYVFYTAVTLIAAIVLFGFGIDFAGNQRLLMLVIGGPVVALADILTNVPVLKAQLRPTDEFFTALNAGQPDPATARRAMVRALNLPVLTLLRIMAVHGPIGLLTVTLLIVLFLNPVMNAGFLPSQIAILWGTLLILVPAHAIFEYFAMLRAVRPVIPIIERHCGALDDEDRRHIVRLGIGRKLLFLSVFITLVPLVFLALSAMVKVNNLLAALGIERVPGLMMPLIVWMAVLIAFSFLATLGMSVLMAREVGLLTGALAQAMRRVAGGDLQTQLHVTSTDEYADLYEGFNRMSSGLQERERLRDAFGRYITPALADEVMQRGVSLGGQAVQVTVLFADIRDFTALAETMPPADVVALLNGYFAAVEPVIEAEGGWINKFGGDSLLAVFGVPRPQNDHTQRAVRAALAMRQAVTRFNARQQGAGSPVIRIGIGLHTGEVVAGNVGSPTRLEYTVIGDVVNLASRIEGLNKQWGTEILVSGEVLALDGGDIPAKVKAMPLTEVQGKAAPIQVYALE